MALLSKNYSWEDVLYSQAVWLAPLSLVLCLASASHYSNLHRVLGASSTSLSR